MHTFQFERTVQRNGLLKPALFRYTVTDGQGHVLLGVEISGREARVEQVSLRSSIGLRKNFWGNAWLHADDTESPFVRFVAGWQSHIVFPDGTDYRIRLLHGWKFFGSKIPGSLQAIVHNGDDPVFVLDDYERRGWFRPQATAYMKGSIHTALTDMDQIAGILLAVQYRIDAQARAGAAAAT